MASAKATEVFDCTPEQFFKIITDYEKYPEIVSEVSECKIVEEKGPNEKIVEFKVSMIKTFSYRLRLKETPNSKLEWSLDSGDIFKTSNGHWILTEENGKTRVEYYVEATFKIFVPGPIAKTLVSVNLPAMMSSYKKRVKELYG